MAFTLPVRNVQRARRVRPDLGGPTKRAREAIGKRCESRAAHRAVARRTLPEVRRTCARTARAPETNAGSTSSRSYAALRSAARPLPNPPIAHRCACVRAAQCSRTRRPARPRTRRQPIHPRRLRAAGDWRARSSDAAKSSDAVAIHDDRPTSARCTRRPRRRTRRSLSRPACAGTRGCRTYRRPSPAAPARARPPFRANCATRPAYRMHRSRPCSRATIAAYSRAA